MNTRTRVGLVGCGQAKRDQPAPAKDLYTSAYFARKWQYVEEECDDGRILSAKHGLVEPDTVLEPYDASLVPRHDSYIGDEAVSEWSRDVQASLGGLVSDFDRPANVETVVLAGEAYAEHVEMGLAAAPVVVSFPFRGKGGLPGQMRWLSEQLEGEDA